LGLYSQILHRSSSNFLSPCSDHSKVCALALQLDTMTAGASTAAVIIVILLVASLVILILQLSGKHITVG